MEMRRGISIVLLAAALGLSVAGCSQDQGTVVTEADAAKIQAAQAAGIAKQIADVEANKNMSAAQKQMVISQIRAGAARSAAGSQAGKASGGTPAK
jgi:hypothetical protein